MRIIFYYYNLFLIKFVISLDEDYTYISKFYTNLTYFKRQIITPVEHSKCLKKFTSNNLISNFKVISKDILASCMTVRLPETHKKMFTFPVSYAHKITLWNLTNGQIIKTLHKNHTAGITSLELLKDGRLISGSRDSTIKIWNTTSGQVIKTLSNHSKSITCLIIIKGRAVISGSEDNTTILWNMNRGDVIKKFSDTSKIQCLALLKDDTLVTGSKLIKLWNIKSGNLIKSLSNHSDSIRSLLVLQDGTLISGSDDKTIKVWNTATGQVIQTLTKHTSPVWALQILTKESFVSVSTDSEINIWDSITYWWIKTLKGHYWIIALFTMNDPILVRINISDITHNQNDKPFEYEYNNTTMTIAGKWLLPWTFKKKVLEYGILSYLFFFIIFFNLFLISQIR